MASERAARPGIAGVAGGVGATTVATGLDGTDWGVFTGSAPVDVLVCRATGDSLVRAARAAQLITGQGHQRPALAVTAADGAGLPRPVSARLRLLEPHASTVVVLPYVRRWHELATPLDEVRGLLTRQLRELPRVLRRYALALHELQTAITAGPARTRGAASRTKSATRAPRQGLFLLPTQAPNPAPSPPPGLEGLANQLLGWLKWGVLVAGVLGILVCAVMIIIGRRNRSATAYEGLVGSAWILAGLALASVAAVIVGAFNV